MAHVSTVSLRIVGDLDIDQITARLAIEPSETHRRGERDIIGGAFENDVWLYKVDTPSRSISDSLEFLADTFREKFDILKDLGTRARVDVFCGITAGEQDGFSISPKAASILYELQVNLEVSLVLGASA